MHTPSAPPATTTPLSPPAQSGIGGQELCGERYTFSPRHSKKTLRAWERRPATPFAPRSDSHKIWKRCEPGDHWVTGREAETWRSVKRLRTEDGHDEDDSENPNWYDGFVATRYEDFRDVERRRKLVTSDACGGGCLNADEDGSEKKVVTGLDTATSPLVLKLAEEDSESRILTVHEDGDESIDPKDHVQQNTASSQSIETPRKSSPRGIFAAFDGSASPIPSPGRESSPSHDVFDYSEAATGTKETGENQQMKIAKPESSPAPKPVVSGFPDGVPSSLEEVVRKVPEISSVDEGDDMEYLHAFLTRAKAKKAATIVSPEKHASTKAPQPAASSPQTRSRTALASLDSNSPSPRKTKKQMIRFGQDDQVRSDMTATSPTRRSTRTRLPRPERHQPAIPSSIPFRRSNGTEFIFLQKTEAQQIAIATRSNTKKNKGEALQPKMKLEALSSLTQPSPVKASRKRKNNKKVSWDEGLAYFAPEQVPILEAAEEPRKHKTPVKRSRRLAPKVGTPAPKKKMAEAALDIGTPVSRTRTRSSGKT